MQAIEHRKFRVTDGGAKKTMAQMDNDELRLAADMFHILAAKCCDSNQSAYWIAAEETAEMMLRQREEI